MTKIPMKNKTVLVGMSGGVDSSVAAYLLKQEGYHVIGITMELWRPESICPPPRGGSCGSRGGGGCELRKGGGCELRKGGSCGSQEADDAKKAAEKIGIPWHLVNFRDVFREKVIAYFVGEYRAGRTPNPCIACNRYVKWEALMKKSAEFGAEFVATGHYARIKDVGGGRLALCRKSGSENKDQTYALYNLTQDQLAHTLFPVGEHDKEEIRATAEEAGLSVAHKSDSQEICFVPGGDYAAFLERETGVAEKPGNFVDAEGRVLGVHRGISCYTVGQRKGLGVAFGEPRFVLEIRPDTNEVVLGKNGEVFSRGLRADRVNYMAAGRFEKGRRVLAKIRYNHAGAPAVVKNAGEDFFELEFPEPVRAVTPGQAAVLYDGGIVLGGGTITSTPRPS